MAYNVHRKRSMSTPDPLLPDEQARAAVFLASDAAAFITGSAMLVDGGVSINKT